MTFLRSGIDMLVTPERSDTGSSSFGAKVPTVNAGTDSTPGRSKGPLNVSLIPKKLPPMTGHDL